MSNNIFRCQIRFGSLLSYSPYDNSAMAECSRMYMRALKKDSVFPNPPICMSDYYADKIKTHLNTLPQPFASLFQRRPVLAPIPTSKSDKITQTVPERLASALARKGLGKVDEIRLKRTKDVPTSHLSEPQKRLTPQEHYETIEVQRVEMMHKPEEILLIDDIVTSGSTLLGAANRLADEFPNAHIRAFAMMRTMSGSLIFTCIWEPIIGNITLEPNQRLPRRRR